MQASWAKSLPDVFCNEGMHLVEVHSGRADPSLWYAMHQCSLLLYDIIISKTAHGKDADQLRSLIPAAVAESGEGAMLTFQRLNVVGQKP